MKFLKWLFRSSRELDSKKEKNIHSKEKPTTYSSHLEMVKMPEWADPNISEEEKKVVAVIATAGIANSMPHKKYRIKRVLKVDQDWKVAGLAALSGISQGKPNEKYRIKSIRRIK